ncbi:non-ribosomal peptide synthetase [Thalassomonas viridans]|uniref:Non-ribosomal peptide synthetase n=1 Tax=Thalassomonas viridans TaxID=137584 RepID=A0AAF0CEE3_9GAMM|nr:non-ribosomal peptide synthetase [Thalassomonas viridans]WDE09180.1 non-ribosomal peptide synthetase [Thalassomonas viridans]
MTTVENILVMCSEQGVELSLDNGALEVLFDEMPDDELVGLLREHKPQIIEYLSNYQQTSQFSPVKKLGQDSGPLSFGQKRLWFIHQLENGSAHYNMPLAMELKGRLDREALVHSLQAIVKRHEVLRTRYEEGGSRQVVNSGVQLEVKDIDLRQARDQEQQLRHLIGQEQLTDFDFNSDLMLRCSLVQMEQARHVLLLTLHHIGCDGWSLGILVDELRQFYRAFATGQACPLPELAVQYTDYAFWQDENRDLLEQQLGFWTRHLAQAPALHKLHSDYPRPAHQSFKGDNVATRVSPEQLVAIHALCRRLDVTPFMLCYSVFALLIARLSNESDVVIGTPIANRNHAAIEPLIGYFANTLALRSQLDAGQTFADFVGQNKAMLLEVFNYQDVPFEMVVDRIQPERNLAYSPLFQILFSFHSHTKGKFELPELELNDITPKANTVKTDLELAIVEDEQGLALDWNFSTALFGQQTIARMAACFEHLLAGILAVPDKALSDYPHLPPADKAQIQQWCGQGQAADAPAIHGLFEKMAAAQPDAQALVCGDSQLSYRDLDRRANQVAHYLLANGIQPEQVIGVQIPRSTDLVVALLGVLKAGACYLPLEASYPKARLDFMLEHSGARLVLTPAVLAEIAGGDFATGKTGLPEVQQEQLAYVIYTSGSTGQPKGVMVSHGNVMRFLQSMSPMLQDKGVWLAVTGVAFDISVLELFGTLCQGFKVVLWGDSEAEDTSVAELIRQESVTHIQCTPSFAAMHLVVDTGAEQLASLQQIFIGGETFPPALAKALKELTCASLHNMYGPTEATVWASTQPVGEDEAAIAIGKPLAGYQIRILGSDLNEQPVGVPGELCIAGAGVARGYLGDEVLTAERFIPSPFEAGERLYKTGDKARWNERGQLEFLGRIDSQVKLRGHRIEPDEISAQLLRHREIKNAVVVLDKHAAGDRLAAYLQPVDWPADLAQTAETAKMYLSELLPAYMVPTAYKVMEALPLTLNGKVNKAALPAIDTQGNTGEYRGPETETEHVLVELWAGLLSVAPESIGCNVSFFDLGGHSLLLTKMLLELKNSFQIEFTIREIFEHPTIEEIAAMLEERRQSLVEETVVDKATTVGEQQTEEFVL